MDKKGTKLKTVRQSKSITQRELAEKTGISLRTLQHYEQGSKDLNMAAAITVHTIARALEVEMEELLDIEEQDGTEEEEPK